GDASVLPQLRQVFDLYPEMVGRFGDLVHHAEQALLTWASGSSLFAREAVEQRGADLRQRLWATAPSQLERLPLRQVCLSYIEAHAAQIQLVDLRRKHADPSAAVEAAERRLGRAQARYLAAIQKLVTVQKLLRPAPSPVDLLRRAVHEEGAPAKPAGV